MAAERLRFNACADERLVAFDIMIYNGKEGEGSLLRLYKSHCMLSGAHGACQRTVL